MILLEGIESSYLTWEGEFGSIVFTNPLGNDFVHHDAPHEMHPFFAKSPNFPLSNGLLTSLSGSKPFWCSSCWNDFLWHPKAFDPIVGLLVHLGGVGDGEHACLLLLFLLCSPPHFSPCTHRTCDLPCGTRSKPWFVLYQASSLP